MNSLLCFSLHSLNILKVLRPCIIAIAEQRLDL